MVSDGVEVHWQRRRGVRKIHVVAALGALLAAASVLSIFGGLGRALRPAKAQPQLIASIDLRIGNTTLAAEGGEAQARADVEAGLLQLQTFGPVPPQNRVEAAKAQRLKQRYGISWVNKPGTPTPASQAYVAAYNRVVGAEIQRRHGRDVLEQVLPKDVCGPNSGVPCT